MSLPHVVQSTASQRPGSAIIGAQQVFKTPTIGLALAWMATGVLGLGSQVTSQTAPTFNQDVAPILNANCVGCHRPGEVAPMSLLTFADARPWARAMKEKLLAREM